ncbi:MAG: hypothetical protein H7197_00980 [Vitreoscilla sp.]|nr:hypothetical protein [Polaromonas sp.]
MSLSELAAEQIPYYLTQQEKEGLVAALSNWPRPIDYYAACWPNEVLQGDTWTRLPIRRFEDGEQGFISGIVLSNSCSIDPKNPRGLPTKITIAPIIALDKYLIALNAGGIASKSIEDKLLAIKEQRVHNIFYLPCGSGIAQDSIALLDDLHSFPTEAVDPGPHSDNKKLVTLSLVGFYLFVLKLSVHFCRFHENVSRRDDVVANAAV